MRWLALLAALLLLAGCGDEEAREEAGEPGRTLVAAVGDSITAGSPGWDPNPAVRTFIEAPDRRSQYEYWAQRRLPGTRFRNCGIAGQRTDQIAARLDQCADGADVLIVQGGINDIAMQVPIETVAANLDGMVARGKQLGLRVLLAELLPWDNGHPQSDETVRRMNELVARIGRDQGVTVLPWYSKLLDPRRPGRMRQRLTSDGDHPSVEGYRLLGEAIDLGA